MTTALFSPSCDALTDAPITVAEQLSAAAMSASISAPVSLWRHVLDLLPSGLIVIDAHGVVAEANPVAVALLGRPLIGERWLAVIGRAFRPRADDGHEVSLHDGRRVKIETRPLSPLPGQLVVLTDLTETRVLQQQISHLERLSALGRMVATLAHQVRTPLASATLYAGHLADPGLSPVARERFAGKLQARLADLEHQVNDMLLYARSGHQGQLERASLAQIFEQLAESCAGVVELQGAQLQLETPPAATFVGYPRALVGALMNLVHNSIDNGGKGCTIRISATINGENLLLQVKDNGPGIADELRERIFEPFFTTRGQGTGLGLAVVQAVMRQHQGEVSVTNNSDGGSCFSLRLPLCQPLAEEAA